MSRLHHGKVNKIKGSNNPSDSKWCMTKRRINNLDGTNTAKTGMIGRIVSRLPKMLESPIGIGVGIECEMPNT